MKRVEVRLRATRFGGQPSRGLPTVARALARRAKVGGEAGIRTLDTGFSPYNGLANRRLQPLGHLTVRSGADAVFQLIAFGAILYSLFDSEDRWPRIAHDCPAASCFRLSERRPSPHRSPPPRSDRAAAATATGHQAVRWPHMRATPPSRRFFSPRCGRPSRPITSPS